MVDIGPILVAIDFSVSSWLALELAATLARRLDQEVLLLHVDEGNEAVPPSDAAVVRCERARRELDGYRERLAALGVRVRAVLRPGDPAREILRVAAANGPGIIVIGTHGLSPISTPLLGSVADRVMRYAPHPVLVVPDPARRPPSLRSAAAV